MASLDASETSLFSLSGVRERMREKKKGALRTAKLNASLASKIKTKIINNSSTIKVSLKHNNKALALALNAEKVNRQRLTQENTILQKEVEQCHFQNAVLRHKLSFLNNTLKEFENLIAAVKLAQLSEFHTSSASLSPGQKSSVTEDSCADDIVDGQLVRAIGMPMRVPISKVCGAGQKGGSSMPVQTFSPDLQRRDSEALETVPVASEDTLPPQPPQPAEKPQFHQEENGKKPTETMEAQQALLDSHVFGEASFATRQNPNSLPVCAWENYPLSHEGGEMVESFFDRLSQGHVTQRRKRSTLFATSTPSSGVDILPCASSTQAARWSITEDRISSSRSNTQPQPKSPSSLVSATPTTVIPDRRSSGKEILCDQPQPKETGCGVEMDPSYSQVPEFVPVKVKSKGSSKTTEKRTVKKASTGKKKTNAIKNSADNSPDIPEGEESAQNSKMLPQPKVTTCSNEPEVSDTRQKVCVGAFDRKNRGCGVEQHFRPPDEVQDLRRTYVVNPAPVHTRGSGDLLQQVRKEGIFEIQSTESLSKSPVHIFSSNEIPPGDSILRNPLFSRKETSSAFALQEDSGVSTKTIRQKTNRKTRIIRQRDDTDEENLPNGVKIPEVEAEEQPKRRRTSRRKTVRKSSCSDQRNESGFGPCIDVQGAVKKSTKDSLRNLKCSRKTYVISPLDLAGNLGCVQTESEEDEITPPKSISGSKASKIPRIQRKVAAQSNENQTGGHQEKGQAEVDNNMNALKKEVCPKPKPQRKRNTSRPPETDSQDRQSDGAKVLVGSSAELVSKQSILTRKFSCIIDAFLKEQIAEISLADNLMDLSESLESSVTSSAALPVSSRITDVAVSKSLSTEGKRMPQKSSVGLERSPILKKKTAEEIPGETNYIESSFQSLSSQEPEIRPLRDLTNARTSSSSTLEGASRYSSRRRRDPPCYAEPRLNSKLRRGDPFTSTDFLDSPRCKPKKKRPDKAKKMTKMIEEDKEQFPEGCPNDKAGKLITMGRDMEPEVK